MKQRPTHVQESLLAVVLAGAIVSWLTASPAAFAIGLLLLVLGGLSIPIALLLDAGWMGLAFSLGKVSQVFLLGIVYFLVLTPLGWLGRILGRADRLMLRKPSGGTFIQRIPGPGTDFTKPW